MRRRDFLTTVAAAGLLPQMTGRAAAAPAPVAAAPEQLKLGVASYSLRKFPFDKALEMAKACDVRYINFKDVHLPRTDSPDAIKAARAKTEAAGFTIMGGGTITWVQKGRAGRTATPAGAQGLRVRRSSPACRSSSRRRASRRSTPSRRLAKEFDIKVAIHNHGPEDKFFPSPYDVYKHVKGRDKHMGLCVDIGHTWRAGVDPTKAVLELQRPRLRSARQGSARPEGPRQPGHRRQGRDRLPGALPRPHQDRLRRARRPRVRDRRRRSAARHAAVLRLHARRAGGHLDRPGTMQATRRRTRGSTGYADDQASSTQMVHGARRSSRRVASSSTAQTPPGGGRQAVRPRAGSLGVQPASLPDAAQIVETTVQPLRVVPMFKGLAAPWSLAFLPNGDMLDHREGRQAAHRARRHARSGADRRHAGSLCRRAGRPARGRRPSAVRAEPVHLPHLLEGQGRRKARRRSPAAASTARRSST